MSLLKSVICLQIFLFVRLFKIIPLKVYKVQSRLLLMFSSAICVLPHSLNNQSLEATIQVCTS